LRREEDFKDAIAGIWKWIWRKKLR
jgi:hypothetical protein